LTGISRSSATSDATPTIVYTSKEGIDKTKAFLHQRFKMEDIGPVKRFLGMDVHQDSEGNIRISQKDYVESILKKYNMETTGTRSAKTPFAPGTKLQKFEETATDEDKLTYQGMVGSLMYASTCTRPDLAYATSTLSRFNNNNPGPMHFAAIKHVLRYLSGTTNYGITYRSGKEAQANLDFHGYCDSDWAGDEDTRRSTSGFVFLMTEGAVSWRSRRQNTVATSSTEAEYVSCALASKEALWIRQLLEELMMFCNPEAVAAKNQIITNCQL
jgi:hypothetical protein